MIEPTNILEFSGVTLQNVRHGQAEMRHLTFNAGRGCLLLVKVETGNEYLPLADAAEGLIAPDTGIIRWQGREWNHLKPRAELHARSLIGRVFEKQGWISNLNVAENITLSQRHHTERPENDIMTEADSLARYFGLPEAPRRRPAFVPERELRIAEWIRAFIGSPLLFLLERPEAGVPDDNLPKLIDAVQSAGRRGAAVIWQTDRDAVWKAAKFITAVRYQMRGTDMVLVEGKSL